MDEHVHGVITRALRQRGVDVLTAQDEEREGMGDDALLSRASELGRAMFSFDSDMLVEGVARQRIRTT
jgi:hypothetical protein